MITANFTTPIVGQAPAPLDQEQSPLASLPLFLIIEILQRLGKPQDILAVGATCKVCQVASQDNQLWRSLFLKSFQTPIPKGTCTEEGASLNAYKCRHNFMQKRYATRRLEGFTSYVDPLIEGNGTLIGGQFDGTIVVSDIKSGSFKRTLEGHKGAVSSFVWAGGNLVSSSQDNKLKVWDLEKGECIQTLEAKVSPFITWIDGHVITKPSDSAIRITNLQTKEFREIELTAEQQGCRSLTCIDKHLIFVDGRGTLTTWDFQTMQKKEIIPEQTDVFSLLEDNGNLILGYTDGMIKFWNMKSGECIKTLQGHQCHVKSLQWARGILISLDIQGRFIFWDLVSDRGIANKKDGLCSLIWANGHLILDYGHGGVAIQDYNASVCEIFAEMARLFKSRNRLSNNEAIVRFSRMPKQAKDQIYTIYQALTRFANGSVEKAFLAADLEQYKLQAQAIEKFLEK
jgi:WD40 repeat protein